MLSQDRSAETVVGAATLRYNLLIKHAVSPSHSILTLGQPVQILTPQCQLPEVPMCKSFIRLGEKSLQGKKDLILGLLLSMVVVDWSLKVSVTVVDWSLKVSVTVVDWSLKVSVTVVDWSLRSL